MREIVAFKRRFRAFWRFGMVLMTSGFNCQIAVPLAVDGQKPTNGKSLERVSASAGRYRLDSVLFFLALLLLWTFQ